MKPAIDQMITWLDQEIARYSLTVDRMNHGFRALEHSRTQALKIKERCDADEIEQAVAAEMAFNNAFGPADGGIQVVEENNGFTGCKFGTHVANLGANGTFDTDHS